MKALILTLSFVWAAAEVAAQISFDTICTLKGAYYIGARVNETADSLDILQSNGEVKSIAKKDLTQCSATQRKLIQEQLELIQDLRKRDLHRDSMELSIERKRIIPVEYNGIETVRGVDKTQLFLRASAWAVKYYRKQPFRGSFDDDVYTLTINTVMHYKPALSFGFKLPIEGNISYSVSIAVKDGRYKYSFGRFTHQSTTTTSTESNNYWSIGLLTEMLNRERNELLYDVFDNRKNEMLRQAQAEIKIALASMQKAMLIQVTPEDIKEDNW